MTKTTAASRSKIVSVLFCCLLEKVLLSRYGHELTLFMGKGQAKTAYSKAMENCLVE